MAKKIKKDESVEELLQQLRDSQGPGDVLLEISGNNVKATTAHGSEENQDIDLSDSEELVSQIWELTKSLHQSLLNADKIQIEILKMDIELEKKGIWDAVYKKFEPDLNLLEKELIESRREMFTLSDERYKARRQRLQSSQSEKN